MGILATGETSPLVKSTDGGSRVYNDDVDEEGLDSFLDLRFHYASKPHARDRIMSQPVRNL